MGVMESMAQELIHFIHTVYGFRMKQVVLDFIKDAEGTFWVTDLKNFTFDEFDKVVYLRLKQGDRKEEIMNRTMATLRCCLCHLDCEKACI